MKGTGPPPEFYNKDKYKNLAEQAKAQRELEKRFGAFTGAPKDGKYAFKMPEGIEGEFDQEDPKFQAFTKWAVDNQLSQDGYQAVLTMYAENIAALTPDIGAIKESLGEKADERINNVNAWVKANIPEASQAAFKAATSGANAAEVFTAIEAMIAKTAQPRMPAPGDAPGGGSGSLTPEQTINAMMAEKLPNGKLRYFEDAAFRRDVEAKRLALYTKPS